MKSNYMNKPKEGEVTLYPLHITQDNSLSDVMSDKVMAILNKYRDKFGIMPLGQAYQPMKYLQSLLFIKPEYRKECNTELKAAGIKTELSHALAFMPKEDAVKIFGGDAE